MKEFAKKAFISFSKIILVIAFWIGLWALLSKKVGLELLLPSPKTTFLTLVELIKTSRFWQITAKTFLRVLDGITVSMIIGFLLAVLTEKSRIMSTLLSPLITVIKSTPVASFIVLALLYFDRNIIPTIIIALIVVPIVWSNIAMGIRSVDKNLAEVTRIYSFSLPKKIFRFYIPSIYPYFLAACKASLGMAWKAGSSAEILSLPKYAIGTELYYAKTYFNSESIFAWTFVIIVLSTLLEKLFIFCMEKLAHCLKFVPRGGNSNVEA